MLSTEAKMKKILVVIEVCISFLLIFHFGKIMPVIGSLLIQAVLLNKNYI